MHFFSQSGYRSTPQKRDFAAPPGGEDRRRRSSVSPSLRAGFGVEKRPRYSRGFHLLNTSPARSAKRVQVHGGGDSCTFDSVLGAVDSHIEGGGSGGRELLGSGTVVLQVERLDEDEQTSKSERAHSTEATGRATAKTERRRFTRYATRPRPQRSSSFRPWLAPTPCRP